MAYIGEQGQITPKQKQTLEQEKLNLYERSHDSHWWINIRLKTQLKTQLNVRSLPGRQQKRWPDIWTSFSGKGQIKEVKRSKYVTGQRC